MRVVLDTNTVVSALFLEGPASQLLAAEADLIGSGDTHLLQLKHYHRIQIVAAAEALRRIEAPT